VSPKGTDTRRRILDVALELFSTQGYEKTSLREIAERLDIKKASLYYHFSSKEALVAALADRLLEPVDELVTWCEAQPPTAAIRGELLRRLATLLQGEWSLWIRFAQANQQALLELQNASGTAQLIQERMLRLFRMAMGPADEIHEQLRVFLAVVAVYIGNTTPAEAWLSGLGITATPDELRSAALDVALVLAGAAEE